MATQLKFCKENELQNTHNKRYLHAVLSFLHGVSCCENMLVSYSNTRIHRENQNCALISAKDRQIEISGDLCVFRYIRSTILNNKAMALITFCSATNLYVELIQWKIPVLHRDK